MSVMITSYHSFRLTENETVIMILNHRKMSLVSLLCSETSNIKALVLLHRLLHLIILMFLKFHETSRTKGSLVNALRDPARISSYLERRITSSDKSRSQICTYIKHT